jgi:hypothetical protein
MADVEVLREVLRTAELGPAWQAAGWPKVAQLDADRLPEAWAWVGTQLGVAPHAYEPEDVGAELCGHCGTSYRARWHATDVPDVPPAEPEAVPDAEPDDDEPAGPPEPLPITDDRTDAERDADGDGPSSEAAEPEDQQAAALAHVAATLAPA